jgi:hypothetical protein
MSLRAQGICEQLRLQLKASEDKCRQLQFALLDGQASTPLTSTSCGASHGASRSSMVSPSQHVTAAVHGSGAAAKPLLTDHCELPLADQVEAQEHGVNIDEPEQSF